jgi:hypothetical protein
MPKSMKCTRITKKGNSYRLNNNAQKNLNEYELQKRVIYAV